MMEPILQAVCRSCEHRWIEFGEEPDDVECPECGSTAVEMWETF